MKDSINPQVIAQMINSAIDKWTRSNLSAAGITRLVNDTLNTHRTDMLHSILGLSQSQYSGRLEAKTDSKINEIMAEKVKEVADKIVKKIASGFSFSEKEMKRIESDMKERYVRTLENTIRDNVEGAAKKDANELIARIGNSMKQLTAFASSQPKPQPNNFTRKAIIDSARVIGMVSIDANDRLSSVDKPSDREAWFLVRVNTRLALVDTITEKPGTSISTTIVTNGKIWRPVKAVYNPRYSAVIDLAESTIIPEFETNVEAVFNLIGEGDLEIIREAVGDYLSGATTEE